MTDLDDSLDRSGPAPELVDITYRSTEGRPRFRRTVEFPMTDDMREYVRLILDLAPGESLPHDLPPLASPYFYDRRAAEKALVSAAVGVLLLEDTSARGEGVDLEALAMIAENLPTLIEVRERGEQKPPRQRTRRMQSA